jgi:hypothetical protein
MLGLPGGQLLVGVEAEDRRVAAAADRAAIGIRGAQRLAGILDDRQAELLERRHVGRIAEHMNGEQRGGASGDRRRGRRRIQVQGDRIDVGEHRARSLVQGDVGRGHEGEGTGDDLVALAHPRRAQGEVQSGGPA